MLPLQSAIDIMTRNIRSDSFNTSIDGSSRSHDDTTGYVLDDKDTPALSFYNQSWFLVWIGCMNTSLKCSVVEIAGKLNTTVR